MARHRSGNATRGEWLRRWIILVSADWLPHFITSSRGCLGLRTEIIPVGMLTTKLSRIPLIDPAHRVADSVQGLRSGMWAIVDLLALVRMHGSVQAEGLTCRATSQMKPASSRAMATQILF